MIASKTGQGWMVHLGCPLSCKGPF